MAEKKVTSTKIEVTSSSKREDKPSVEELRKKRDEVLKRLDKEIGDEEAVVEEKIEVEVSDDVKESESEDVAEINEEKTEEKRELMEQEIISEDKEINEESSDEETKEELKKEPKSDILSSTDEEKNGGAEETADESSPFSAAEFGLADKTKNKSKNLVLFLIIFILVVLISAAFYFYFTGAFVSKTEDPETSITPTEAPSPTPEASVFERSEVTVQVLNGTGTAGVAGEMQEFLEGLGYENVEVGNAEEFDYENVTVQLKEEYEDYFEEISSDLEEEYTVNEEYEVLEDDSEYEIVVIIGTAPEDDSEDELSDE